MSEPRQLRNIALVGFMGTGKSSVGLAVASQLRFRLVDTDDLIERRAQKHISEIFAQEGEERFREYERATVQDLSHYKKAVIATGGGLVVDPANFASLKSHALVVCLWASPEVIWKRVRHQSHRPLLNTPDPLASIRSLLGERERFYKQADVLISTEGRSVKTVAFQVVNQYRIARTEQCSHERPNPAPGT